MEHEWQIPDADVPIEQGDIVISRSVKTGVINEIFLVITADCDISHRKFGTDLACLRIKSLKDYLRNTWAERKLDRLVRNEATKMAQLINKWNSRRISDALPLTADVVMNWIRDSDPKQICTDLRIPESDFAKVEKSITVFRSAIQALESRKESDSLFPLCVFRSIMSGQCIEDCRKDVLRQAQNRGFT